MSKRNIQLLSLATIVALNFGCSSTPSTNAENMGMTIPTWVTNPTSENGLAAASCVTASNNFAMDKSQAAMQARAELATQLDTRIASLREAYSEKLSTADETLVNSKFLNTSTQFTDQALQGSKTVKVDYAQMGDQKNLCALVTISQEQTQALFKRVMKKAPVKLSPENETLLYLNFTKAERGSL